MDKPIIIFGIVVAVFIAGSFSYVNLVNGKEQKLSEFRQAWIDAFRSDLSSLVSAVAFITYYYEVTKKPKAQDIEESYKEYVASFSALVTRLNAQDPDIPTNHVHSLFLETLNEQRDRLNEKKYEQVKELSNILVEQSKPLLKSEWERVKLGEKGYRKNKLVVSILCVIALLLIINFVLNLY